MPKTKEVAETIFVVGWFPLTMTGMVLTVVGVTNPPNAGLSSVGIVALFSGLIWARIVGRVVFRSRWG